MKASETIHIIVRKGLFYILGFINIIIPKRKRQIFFSDISVVRDNQYVLLHHLIEHGYSDKYKIFFYSESDCFLPIELSSHITVLKSKIAGLFYRLSSKYVFFAFGSNFMSCPSPKRQVTIDLWHGFGLKKIEYEVAGSKHIIPLEKTFTNVIVPSTFYIEMIKKSLHCSDEQIIVTGSPKNDGLYSKKDCLSLIGIDRAMYKKIVFYLPTYRNSARLGFSGYSSDLPLISEDSIDYLNACLASMRLLLIVKLHHTAQRDISIRVTMHQASNVKFLTNDDFNSKLNHFYEAMGKADAIVTDYSSVYQDFLLLNKPIGFVIDDFEEYERLRGFNFEDPLSIMPGTKIRTIDDLITFLKDLSDGKDEFISERERINCLLNDYRGKNNCEVLLSKLGITN